MGDRCLRFAWPPPPWQSLAVTAGVLALVGLIGVLLGAFRGAVIPLPLVILDAALVVGFLPSGLLAIRSRPRSLNAALLAAIGLLALVALAASAWSGLFLGAWLAHWAWWPPLALLPVVLLCYPGTPRTGVLRRWLDVAAFAAAAGTGCLLDAAAVSRDADLFTHSRQFGSAAMILSVGWLVCALVTVAATVIALTNLVRRNPATAVSRVRHQGPGARRDLLICLFPAVALVPLAALLSLVGVPMAHLVPLPALGWGLAAGLLPDPHGHGDARWHRGVTAVLTTTLWGGLATMAIVWLLPLVAGSPSLVTWTIALLTLAVVAATTPWWWAWLSALTARLRYGQLREPYLLLTEDRGPGKTRATLAEVSAAVSQVVGSPGVRIRVLFGSDALTVAETGSSGESVEVFPVEEDGQVVGHLEVSLPVGLSRFTDSQQATLQRAARVAAAAWPAERAGWAAAHARSRLVALREAERVRLRSDLGEAFAPVLADCREQLLDARRRMPSARTAALLEPVIEALAGASDSIAAVMERLWPAVLDQGLVAAVAAAGAQQLPGTPVKLDVRGDVGELPAEVALTAYRIIGEALACVAGRGEVSSVRVILDAAAPEALTLVVLDDGPGSPDGETDQRVSPSRSLTQMRTWAEEIGGRLTLLSSSTGSRLSAVLPMPDPIGSVQG